jgi:hypothetical protein
MRLLGVASEETVNFTVHGSQISQRHYFGKATGVFSVSTNGSQQMLAAVLHHARGNVVLVFLVRLVATT